MYKHVSKRSEKAGLSPGTPVYVGKKKVERVRITVIDYDDQRLEIREVERVEECFPFKETPTTTWINVEGFHEIPIVEQLGQCYGLHPLIVEDILNTEQRPKIDIFDNYIFVVLRMHDFDSGNQVLDSEQVSIIFGDHFVITFQEKEGDIFDAIRNRIKNKIGRIRRVGPDYLAYALMDALVDSYFKILENIDEEIEALEEQLITDPTLETSKGIHFLKKQMILFRKSVWPLREIISGLQRTETPLIKDLTKVYLRDLYDHTIQVIETAETLRDMISGLLDTYLSGISNRMNQIMKVLTIFASIFIPLTFIVGIYGMNFDYMPELKWKWGYFAVLAFLFLAGFSLLFYFKKKKWL